MTRRSATLLSLVLILTLACGSHPVGLSAQAGSTIGLAVAGEATEGTTLGYGASSGAVPIYDDQRGELVFVLKNPGTGAEYSLDTRLVTRVYPDPASDAGIANQVDAVAAGFGLAQPLALADVPASTPPATYDLLVRRRLRTSPGTWQTNLPHPNDPVRRLSVLPASVSGIVGASTPFNALAGLAEFPVAAYLPKMYPHPKITMLFTGPTAPSAAHVVLTYPAEKMTVKTVFEEQHLGRTSIVSFTDEPASGRITIDLADPAASVRQLALAFELTDPFGAGRVADAEFNIDPATKLYDANGALLTGSSVSKGTIR